MHGMIATKFVVRQSFIFRRITVLITKMQMKKARVRYYYAKMSIISTTYKLAPSFSLNGVMCLRLLSASYSS